MANLFNCELTKRLYKNKEFINFTNDIYSYLNIDKIDAYKENKQRTIH